MNINKYRKSNSVEEAIKSQYKTLDSLLEGCQIIDHKLAVYLLKQCCGKAWP